MSMKGKKHTDETKAVISQKLKDKWKEDAYKEKLIERLTTSWSHTYDERVKSLKKYYTTCKRKEYSERMKKKWEEITNFADCKMPAWRGIRAGYEAKHMRVRKRYLKHYCEKCGINRHLVINVQNRGLALHCISGNLDDVSPENWMTLCTSCHQKIHRPPITVHKERRKLYDQ